MRNKSALILGGIVLALGLYAYFGEYKREVNEEKQKETDSKIVSLKKEQIQKIDIKKGEGITIVLQRTVDGWNMLEPIQDQADNDTVESFLDQITGEKAVDQIEPKTADLSEYGFRPSMGKITLQSNTNQKQEIEIGTKKNFEGLAFLKRDQENKILTSSQTWMTFLAKPVDQFRNLKLFRGLISKVNMIRVTNSEGSFEFRYNDGYWFSPQKTEWKIDQNAVREILTQATLAKGTGLIDEKKLGPVGAHLLTLEFVSGKDTWKGLLHQDTKTKDVIAAVSPDRLIIRFAPQTLEELRNKKLIDYKDKAEPFHLQTEQVKKIVAHTKLKSFTLIKKNDSWELEKPDPTVVVNNKLAQDIVGKVSRMTAYHFIEGAQPKPVLDSEVQFFDENNKPVFQLSWSEFKNHEGFAKTSTYHDIFQMDDAQINRLAFHEVVKPVQEKTDDKKPADSKPPLELKEFPQKEK